MWLFYLIVFLIPSNLAKHFPLASSYVSGNLVDYLIPAIYLTDILIILLLIIKPIKSIPKPLLIFLLCLLPSVFFSASPIPAIFKWFKFLEFSLLAAWIKQYRPPIIKPLLVAVIFQSLLALGQWFHQGSLFHYWFFGEQPYSSATPGIDKITWFDGSFKIPPLGTTPHPNVLAGFLVISLALLKGPSLRSKVGPYWIIFSSALLTIFFTFSLSAWLAFLLIGLPLILQGWTLQAFKSKPYWKLFLVCFGFLLIILSIFGQKLSFLAPESSFSRRSELTKIALKMWRDHPLTGVGLNNFTVTMDQYGYIPASTRFLQPVHNIYLLILSESGLLGLFGFLYLFLKGRSLFTDKVRPCHPALLLLLFLGLFDHYLLTLQTGLLLTFILFLTPRQSSF